MVLGVVDVLGVYYVIVICYIDVFEVNLGVKLF